MESPKKSISEEFIQEVCSRLVEDRRVRRKIPPWGRLHFDRKLPFLCLYRRPKGYEDPETEKLVRGEAAYLVATGNRQSQKGLRSLVRQIAQTMSVSFGAFLILEIWSARANGNPDRAQGNLRSPAFRIFAPGDRDAATTVEALEAALKRIRIRKLPAEVQTVQSSRVTPAGLSELIPKRDAKEIACLTLGLEIEPIYRDASTGQPYPLIVRAFHSALTRALKRTFYEFSRSKTSLLPAHFLSLGRRAFVKAVWEVDQQLAKVGDAFDFLLYVTPTNADSAWTEFRRKHFDAVPKFTYRCLPIEPALIKRQLFNISMERIEEPVMAHLFREKQQELDRKLTLLSDRDSRRFMWGSIQLFGGGDQATLKAAEELIRFLPPRSRDDSDGGHLDAKQFAERAAVEIAHYRKTIPDLSPDVEIRRDITGLIVSRGRILIGNSVKIPASRAEALIQHEVGTHLLTYLNGMAQPFKQLYSGLAGYEELQEGLAVMAEYLSGGLSRPRLRLLCARVIAVQRLLEGATFIDTFRELDRDFDFARRSAFMITLRVYRAGGLTKDAVYLKGFLELVQYLKKGGELDPLLVGKIAFTHIPIVKEMRWRRVFHPPMLRPRYLEDPLFPYRLELLRNSSSIKELMARRNK
jgi:uncharacterized protein (TIGR02421 family)